MIKRDSSCHTNIYYLNWFPFGIHIETLSKLNCTLSRDYLSMYFFILSSIIGSLIWSIEGTCRTMDWRSFVEGIQIWCRSTTECLNRKGIKGINKYWSTFCLTKLHSSSDIWGFCWSFYTQNDWWIWISCTVIFSYKSARYRLIHALLDILFATIQELVFRQFRNFVRHVWWDQEISWSLLTLPQWKLWAGQYSLTLKGRWLGR